MGVFSARNFVWLKGFLQTTNIFSSCLPALLAYVQKLIARKIAVRVPFRKPLDWLLLGCGFLEKNVSAEAVRVGRSWLVTVRAGCCWPVYSTCEIGGCMCLHVCMLLMHVNWIKAVKVSSVCYEWEGSHFVIPSGQGWESPANNRTLFWEGLVWW